jgi:tetratricopeptide (TPR) repeat protein
LGEVFIISQSFPSQGAAQNIGFLFRFASVLGVLVAVLVLIYWPGISGPMVLDDYRNLSPIGENDGVTNLQNFMRYLFGNSSGPTGRPVAMLSFLIDTQHWPPNVASLKYTNVLIHALNGVLLAWLTLLLFQVLGMSEKHSAMFALLVAALWLFHPLNTTTALYVIQRMTQLMTFFALAALICYLKGRALTLQDARHSFLYLCLALFPFGVLSVLSKENGALLLLLIVVFELSVFRQSSVKHLTFKLWYRLGVILPLLCLGFYLLLTFPSNMEGYDVRPFTMGERLLSEMRALTLYAGGVFVPSLAEGSVFHDDFEVSRSLFAPISTFASLIFLVASLSLAIISRKEQPMLFFGIAWFFSMHLLESTYLPLELYFEHRNYLAMVGPLISFVWYLYVFLQGHSEKVLKIFAKAVVGVFLGVMFLLTWQQAMLWGSNRDLLAYWAYETPGSVRAQISYADYLAPRGATEEAMERLEIANEAHPKEITIMLHMWNMACEYGTESPYSLEQIAAMDNLEYFQNDINFYLRALLEDLMSKQCQFPRHQTMIAFFEKLEPLIRSELPRASYHFLYSDLFVYYRQLDPALIQLTKAFELSGFPEIPIRQAMLTASADNNADALVFLQRAREANQQQSFLLPSYEDEIVTIERDIKKRMAAIQ